MPGSRSSPVTALQPWMRQWWLRMEARSRAWGQKGLVEPAGLSLSFPGHPGANSSCTPVAPLGDIKSTWAAECLLGARHFAGTTEVICLLLRPPDPGMVWSILPRMESKLRLHNLPHHLAS